MCADPFYTKINENACVILLDSSKKFFLGFICNSWGQCLVIHEHVKPLTHVFSDFTFMEPGVTPVKGI